MLHCVLNFNVFLLMRFIWLNQIVVELIIFGISKSAVPRTFAHNGTKTES